MSDDINVNYIADQLAKKVDLPDNKGQDGIDYVVEWKKPTSSDPTWYRVYKSGWVEQGGRVSISQDTQTTVTLLKTFSNTDYTVLISACRLGTQIGGDGNFTVEYVSTSQFKWSNGDDFDGIGIWYACGQGA